MIRINKYRDIVPDYKYPICISKYYIGFSKQGFCCYFFKGLLCIDKKCYRIKNGESTAIIDPNNKIKEGLSKIRYYICNCHS